MYNQEILNFFTFFQCDCTVNYDDILFHIFGHEVKHTEDYVHAQLADYIREHRANIEVVARDLFKRKEQLLKDYLEFIQHPGHRGMNFQSICSPTWATGQFVSSQKLGIGVLLRGGAEEVDINLVYLGRSVFQDTNAKAKKSRSVYKQEEVNEHVLVHSDDSFRMHTRSMDHTKRPTQSPSPSPECPV